MEKAESTITLEKEDGQKFKDKLKQWYIKEIANNGDNIKKVYDARTTIQNAAGSAAVCIFLPEFIALIPAIQAFNKYKNNLEYGAAKGIIHHTLDISPEELNVKPVSKDLDSLDNGELESIAENVATSIFEKGKSK